MTRTANGAGQRPTRNQMGSGRTQRKLDSLKVPTSDSYRARVTAGTIDSHEVTLFLSAKPTKTVVPYWFEHTLYILTKKPANR